MQCKKKRQRSYRGCHSCRYRSIKCDETKPECKRCISYGITCSYASKPPKEDPLALSRGEIAWSLNSTCSPEPRSSPVVSRKSCSPPSISVNISYWPSREVELINKFQLMTVSTISTGNRTYMFRTHVVEQARIFPFLHDSLLTLTSMHEHWLYGDDHPEAKHEESIYRHRAVTAFSRELMEPRSSQHQASLVIASVIIYMIAFASIDAQTPEEAWPLAPRSAADLGWLKMNLAKRDIPQLGKSMGPNSAVTTLQTPLAPHLEHDITASPILPPGFASLFELDSWRGDKENPYYLPAMHFLRIKNSRKNVTVSIAFTILLGSMQDEFKDLLYQKDARALLLLACWFAVMSRTAAWWYRKRALLEGQSICLYLERYHGNNIQLQVLLEYPKGVLFDPQTLQYMRPKASEFGL